MKFDIVTTYIPDLIIIDPAVYKDERGFFMEFYNLKDFSPLDLQFVQANHSRSRKGVLRGLHYQISPMAQGKLVKCVNGEIFDVAVDIRKGSPTFGKWYGTVLSDKNNKMLYIPEGFAHGFYVLSETADVVYLVTNFYSPEHERGIRWNDPTINIEWPSPNPLVSPKDFQWPELNDAEINFYWENNES